jgi:hypothetical protein
MKLRCCWLLVVALLSLNFSATEALVPLSVRKIPSKISTGFEQRVAADPSFPTKSVTELLIAAGTQLTAEWSRRGASRLIPEIDFIVAAILTAMAGKYYAMWRVAPTKGGDENDEKPEEGIVFAGIQVPTNAFQATLLDGTTRPTLQQRLLSIIVPMPSLFRAGFVASIIGYGLTALFIVLRTVLLPSYEAVTQNINVLHACLFTGGFLAIVSNLRYQTLQGLIEPWLIEKPFKKYPYIRAVLTFVVRWANGLLGSVLSIMGMRYFGLQQLKEQ